MILQTATRDSHQTDQTLSISKASEDVPEECNRALHILDCAPAPGWTTHVNRDGRLYYCNHVTRAAGWLPPSEAWRNHEDALPYGWERAVDETGRTYYINHVNKTTTYETPAVKNATPVPLPEPRSVTLERSAPLGFGFVAGSEKPVVVRFVTEGGPSVDKLLPGDQILSVNGENVKNAPREHVITLVRNCAKSVTLDVCQPAIQQGIRKSTLLSANKRARLKNKPSKVRFAENVCINGSPLFSPSAFSLGDFHVAPMANVLKVFLENGQTKSFKYDTWTTVQDVVNSLQTKLCLQATEYFSLVVEHVKSTKRNKLTLLDPQECVAKIASQPGAHKLRCLFRVTFVPMYSSTLAKTDLNALDYLYNQCCNDVIQERFAPELQYDTALRLAALHMYEHALANNMQANKLTVKIVEREFGLERFIATSLLENLKRKEVRKLLSHFLKFYAEMAGPGKQLTSIQVKLHYLDIVSQLPSYGAKCFSVGPTGDTMERVILVSPKFGVSQITGNRNSVFQPVPIANIEDMRNIEVINEDEDTRIVLVTLANDKILQMSLEERDAVELVLILRGYFKLHTGTSLSINQEKLSIMADLPPSYLSQHRVIPERWSYIELGSIKSACFTKPPVYQNINKKTNGLYNTIGRHSKASILAGCNLEIGINSTLPRKVNQNINNFYNQQKDAADEKDEVARNMRKLRLIENPDYFTERQAKNNLQYLFEGQETSVDIDSESEESEQLKHSDSLLLLNKIHTTKPATFPHATVEQLRQESVQSESDNESIYTPFNSPKKKIQDNNLNTSNEASFGLRSPIHTALDNKDFQEYLEKICEIKNKEGEDTYNLINNVYSFDPDIIDLTMLPPPRTPDELDTGMKTPVNVPPKPFADQTSSNHQLGHLDLNISQDLEEFLSMVTVPPPTQKVTPAMELTTEEIMAYIIPPPPARGASAEDLEQEILHSQEIKDNNLLHKRNSDTNVRTSRRESESEFSTVKPLPRRSLDEKPPERPPKRVLREPTPPFKKEPDNTPTPKLPPRNVTAPHPTPPPVHRSGEQHSSFLFGSYLETLRQKRTMEIGKDCAMENNNGKTSMLHSQRILKDESPSYLDRKQNGEVTIPAVGDF